MGPDLKANHFGQPAQRHSREDRHKSGPVSCLRPKDRRPARPIQGMWTIRSSWCTARCQQHEHHVDGGRTTAAQLYIIQGCRQGGGPKRRNTWGARMWILYGDHPGRLNRHIILAWPLRKADSHESRKVQYWGGGEEEEEKDKENK